MISLTFTLSLLILPVSQIPAAKVKINKKPIFATAAWYKNKKGKEEEFVGILSKVNRGKGVVGSGRFNPYRLSMKSGKKLDQREVYIGDKGILLDPYLGKKVKLIGKRVDWRIEGQAHREIWPAYLVVLDSKQQKSGKGQKTGVYSQAYYNFLSSQPGQKPIQRVIRHPKELKSLSKKANLDRLLKALKVKKINWDKQMLVVVSAGSRPTGGWRVVVRSANVNQGKMLINYSVMAPKGIVTQAFTHPAAIALVDRFDGPFQFRMQKLGGRKKRFPPSIDRIK